MNDEGTAAEYKTQGGSVLLLVWALRGGGGLRQLWTLCPAYLFTLSLVRRVHISYCCLGHQSDGPHSWVPSLVCLLVGAWEGPGMLCSWPKGPLLATGF